MRAIKQLSSYVIELIAMMTEQSIDGVEVRAQGPCIRRSGRRWSVHKHRFRTRETALCRRAISTDRHGHGRILPPEETMQRLADGSATAESEGANKALTSTAGL